MKSTSESSHLSMFYDLEHILEAPLEIFLLGKTRYHKDNWFFRCMESRLLWLSDNFAYIYYSMGLETGKFDEKEWRDFVVERNKNILKFITCETFQKMKV